MQHVRYFIPPLKAFFEDFFSDQISVKNNKKFLVKQKKIYEVHSVLIITFSKRIFTKKQIKTHNQSQTETQQRCFRHVKKWFWCEGI